MRNDITYTKAIGITLMVLCHAINAESIFNSFVYMFHMPLFFFFSGYCLKAEYFDRPRMFLWKRIKGLYWPFVKWNVIFLLLHNASFGIHLYSTVYGFHGKGNVLYSNSEVWHHLLNTLFLMRDHELLLGGYWFLRALFVGSVIAFLTLWLIRVVRRKMHVGSSLWYFVGFLFLVVLCVWDNHAYYSQKYNVIPPQDLAAASLFYAGYGFRCFCFRKFRWYEMIAALVVVSVGSFLWPMGLSSYVYSNHRLLPYLFTAVLGTWAVYSLPWQWLTVRMSEMLRFIGMNTLTILTWHFLAFKSVSLLIIIIYRLPIDRLGEFPVIVDYAVRGWWIAYFLVAMIASCAIAYCNRWICSPWLKL